MANTYSLDIERGNSQYAYITDANQTGLDLTGDFTFEAWIKVESDPSDVEAILAKLLNTGGKGGYRFYWFAQHIHCRVWNSSDKGFGYVTDNNVVATGAWHHVAVSHDSSEKLMVIYIDGSSVNVTKDLDETGSGGVGNTDAPFYIGADPATGSYVWGFDGLIDEVRVWSDIRTSTEISDNYNKQLVGNEANLVGYWQFNDDYLDLTSNNNDLTAVNSPVFSTDVPFVGSPIKSINGLAKASIKSINGCAIGSVKSFNGLT